MRTTRRNLNKNDNVCNLFFRKLPLSGLLHVA